MKIAVLLLLFSLICFASAGRRNPGRWYVGGNFRGAHGHRTHDVMRWSSSDPEPGFEPIPGFVSQRINSISIVPGSNSFFVGGLFETIGKNVRSRNIAFYNGTTDSWCPIRQGLDGEVLAVKCTSETECYMVGKFLEVDNSGKKLNARRVAHYSLVDGEWVFNPDLEVWSVNCSTCAIERFVPAVDALEVAFLSGLPYIFVLDANGDLWRGSQADNGWVRFQDALDEVGITTVRDFSIIGSNMWVVGDPMLAHHAHTDTIFLHEVNSIVFSTFITNLDTQLFFGFSKIVAVDENTRYMTCLTTPSLNITRRWYVCKQEGLNWPVRLGLPFVEGDGSDPNEDPFSWIGVAPQGGPLVMGSFQGANWVEDTSPVHPDPLYNRNLDNIYYTAAFDSEENTWYQPFGGGLSQQPAGVEVISLGTGVSKVDYAYFWIASGEFMGYDVLGNGAIYYDEDSALVERNQRPWFPLVHHKLVSRLSEPQQNTDRKRQGDTWEPEIFNPPSGVYAVLPRGDGMVYVAGKFDYVGRDRRASIFLTRPQRTRSNFTTVEVAGGLWKLNFDTPDIAEEWAVGGVVTSVLPDDSGGLYAAGYFDRSGNGAALRNIARYRYGSADWVSLGGGCDGPILAMVIWKGSIVVTGSFSTCGNKWVSNIALWNGASWSALNSGIDGPGFALTEYKNDLVVGGYFVTASGAQTYGVAGWDGDSFNAFKNPCDHSFCGIAPQSDIRFQVVRVTSLLTHAEKVYALAMIKSTDPLPVPYLSFPMPWAPDGVDCALAGCEPYPYETVTSYLVQWDGSSWQLVSPVTMGAAFSLAGPRRDKRQLSDAGFWLGNSQLYGQSLSFNASQVLVVSPFSDKLTGFYSDAMRFFDYKQNLNYHAFETQQGVFVDSSLAIEESAWYVKFYSTA